MKKAATYLLALASLALCAAAPYKPFTVDWGKSGDGKQFDVTARQNNGSPLVGTFLQNGSVWPYCASYTWEAKIMKSNNSDESVTLTGVVATSNTVSFTVATNSLTMPLKNWYIEVIATSNAVSQYSAEGTINVLRSPGIYSSSSMPVTSKYINSTFC